MNLIDKVTGNRIANDNNKYLIALWKGLQTNKSRPTEISKEFYSDVRDCFNGKNSKYDDFTIGWVGLFIQCYFKCISNQLHYYQKLFDF